MYIVQISLCLTLYPIDHLQESALHSIKVKVVIHSHPTDLILSDK